MKPFDQVKWERRSAEITDDSGNTIFKQDGVEVPDFWSLLATKVVVESRRLGRLPAISFLLWRLTKPGVRLARSAFGKDPLPRRLLLRVWQHCWLGVGAYSEGRRVARRRAAAVRPETVRPE